MRPKAEVGRCFSSNHIVAGDSVFDYSMHCKDNVLPERCLVRREHRTREEAVRPHSVHRG